MEKCKQKQTKEKKTQSHWYLIGHGEESLVVLFTVAHKLIFDIHRLIFSRDRHVHVFGEDAAILKPHSVNKSV